MNWRTMIAWVCRTAVLAALVISAQVMVAQDGESIIFALINDSGRPWSRAHVQFAGPSGVFEAVTDLDGTLRVPIRWMLSGEFRIRVSESGFAVGETVVRALPDRTGATVNGQHVEWGPESQQIGGQNTVVIHIPGGGGDGKVGSGSDGKGGLSPPPPPPPLELPNLSIWWNTWIEEHHDTLQFEAVDHLKIDQAYSLVVDLDTLAYQSEKGLESEKAGTVLKLLLEKAVHSGLKSLDLDLYLLYDQRYFVPLDFKQLYQQFPVSVSKLNVLVQKQAQGNALPSSIPLKSAGNPQYDGFRLARAAFPLRTNRKSGTTFLGISVWYHGTPVEEITLQAVCVKTSETDSCPTTNLQPNAFSGFDSSLLPFLDRAKQPEPAAAIHFIDFGILGTQVVFKCNGCPQGQNYFSWRIGKRLPDVAAEMKSSILSTVDISAANSNPAWLETAGKAITGLLLFGDDPEESDGARSKLAELMSNPSQGNTPALFVRSISNGADPFFLFPLGLASINVNGANEYVGYHFRIETPLVNADYTTGPCIHTWRLLVPNDTVANHDSALGMGRAALKEGLDNLGTLQKCTSQTSLAVCEFDDMKIFSDWVNSSSPEQPSTALLLLSHHSEDQLYWDKAAPVPASLFQARFQSPSVVVFNACGTAKPGETELMRKLNLNGMSSVVATFAEVPGSMAGRFSSILIDRLHKKSTDNSYSLSQAVYDAQMQLHDEPIPQTGLPPGTIPQGTKYGPFALLFGLVGDGGVRVCAP